LFYLRDQFNETYSGHLVRHPNRPRQRVLGEDRGEGKRQKDDPTEKVFFNVHLKDFVVFVDLLKHDYDTFRQAKYFPKVNISQVHV